MNTETPGIWKAVALVLRDIYHVLDVLTALTFGLTLSLQRHECASSLRW
jgi:hypothetical protein